MPRSVAPPEGGTWVNKLEQRQAMRAGDVGSVHHAGKAKSPERDMVELRRLRKLLEATRVVPWEADAGTWAFTYVGPQAVQLLGYPVERWYEGDFWSSHIHPDDRHDALEYCLTQSQKGGDYDFEYRMISASGTTVWLHDLVTVESIDGVPRVLRGFLVDITERKVAEHHRRASEERFRWAEAEAVRHRDTLAHATRVASLGELAAALAHELNQPLAAILSNAQAARNYLRQDPPKVDEVRETLRDIIAGNRRAGELIRRVRSMMKKERTRREPVDVGRLVIEVVDLMRSALVIKNVAITLDMSSDIPLIHADRIQIQQVLMNLVTNGIEAMMDREAPGRKIRIGARGGESGHVTISVQDTGMGVETTRLSGLFKSFSSSKPEGLGMGLAICRSLVEAHGGRIWAANNPDCGATFSFTLPSAPELPA